MPHPRSQRGALRARPGERPIPASLRYPLARPDLSGRERRYLLEALGAGAISSIGPHVGAFEEAFARAVGTKGAVAVSHGTAAVHLALAALEIGPGDEVIVPSLTFVSAANAVRYTGARVVLVDADPASWQLDPARVERAITARTRAILAVHLYGNPADLDALRRVARRRRLALIEDCAEALGARWRGRPVGGVGDLGCFSFYGNKVVTTGEGGMVTARSARLLRRVRALRDQGMSSSRRYYHTELAFNYRMTALQAAVGLAQLERLDAFLEKRARVAGWYRRHLRGVAGLAEPRPHPRATPVSWLYTIGVDGWTRGRRDRAMAALRRRGIDSRPVFVPMSELPMYRRRGFPVASRLAASGISLPTYVGLGERDVREIATVFSRIAAR